jgi:hypothetical protein
MFLTALIGFTTAYFLVGVSLVVDAIRRLSRNKQRSISAKVNQPALKISASGSAEQISASR